MPDKGVLLVNLGTPSSPKTKDVRKYLRQFLLDWRVIDIPWWKRNLLVRGIIAPFRAPKSAKTYEEVWMEEGSPLLVYGEKVRDLLQDKLGNDYKVVLAMRYQYPSIRQGLNRLQDENVNEIVILPLFPQYASATTGSVHERVMREVQNWLVIPELHFVSRFYDHPKLLQAFVQRGKQYDIEQYDHVVFSYHGLPERQILKASRDGYCQLGSCCSKMTQKNFYCYRAQCFHTTRLIAEGLELDDEDYSVTFQSRLGNDPWLKPYTDKFLMELPEKGKKNVLVFSPSFVCDCIETTHEIGEENAEYFEEAGGEHLQLVEGLNTHPLFVEALEDIIKLKSDH